MRLKHGEVWRHRGGTISSSNPSSSGVGICCWCCFLVYPTPYTGGETHCSRWQLGRYPLLHLLLMQITWANRRPRVSDEFIQSLDIFFVLMAEPKQTIAKMILSTPDPPGHPGPYVEGLEPPVKVELDRYNLCVGGPLQLGLRTHNQIFAVLDNFNQLQWVLTTHLVKVPEGRSCLGEVQPHRNKSRS